MKRFLIVLCSLFFSHLAYSQNYPNAIGLRLGGTGNSNNAEISYQKAISDITRWEVDLGISRHDGFNNTYVAAIHQWNWSVYENEVFWFAGVGGATGVKSYESGSNQFTVSAGAQLGIEYDLDKQGIPLLVSLDTRPMIDLIGNSELNIGLALGVRYVW